VGDLDHTRKCFQELRGRNVELLIGRVPPALIEDDLAFEKLFDEPLVAVAGLGSSWARRRHLELAELIEEPWVLPPYDSVRGPFIAEPPSIAQPTSGMSIEPLRIGVLTDMTGPFSDISGPGAVLAVRMAVEDFGGKVLGRPINILTADHQNKPDIGLAVARDGSIGRAL
jgi:DNA-binding transcriptional LysR family regulator